MFKRRTPRTIMQNVKESIWPSSGWRRAFKYIRLRVVRLSDTSAKIAAGLAIGVAVSFSPLMGTHLIQAALIAYIIRANVIASLIGTIIGNPWTFPFIWWAAISLGSALFGLFGLPASTNLPEVMDISIFWDLVTHDPLRIFLPWMLGGYLIALVIWPFCYFFFYNLVKGAKAARKKALLHKVHKAAKDLTGQKE